MLWYFTFDQIPLMNPSVDLLITAIKYLRMWQKISCQEHIWHKYLHHSHDHFTSLNHRYDHHLYQGNWSQHPVPNLDNWNPGSHSTSFRETGSNYPPAYETHYIHSTANKFFVLFLSKQLIIYIYIYIYWFT